MFLHSATGQSKFNVRFFDAHEMQLRFSSLPAHQALSAGVGELAQDMLL